MSAKRILVTGASGFIGRQVLPLLQENGDEEVIALHRGPSAPAISAAAAAATVRWIQSDLFDRSALRKILAETKPSHLLHLGWSVPHETFWTSRDNLDWSAASLTLFRDFFDAGGSRWVGAGSCAEYLWGSREPLAESTTPLKPATLYGQAKKAVFETLAQAASQDSLSWAWGRVFFLYGPHENPKRFVRFTLEALLAGRHAPLSDGRQVRDFLHVKDVARAFCRLLDSEASGAVNIGSGEGCELKTLASLLEKATGTQGLLDWGARPRPTNDPDTLVSDNSRLICETSWRPEFSLEQGLRDYVAWRKQNPG